MNNEHNGHAAIQTALWRPFYFAIVMAVLTGLATWPAAVGNFIVWMAERDGRRAYTIPDLLFHASVGWKDALGIAACWLIGAVLLYAVLYGVLRSHSRAHKANIIIQLVLGTIYIVLMAYSTVGLWSAPV